jgi:hypothetical protein
MRDVTVLALLDVQKKREKKAHTGMRQWSNDGFFHVSTVIN